MKVTTIENMILRVPLAQPVATSTAVFSHRDFNVVRLTTDEGITGVGYARGGESVHAVIDQELAPRLVGVDPLTVTAFWERAYEEAGLIGGRGVFMRALSAVDIALWDAKAKALGLPLWKLLGGDVPEVPVYVSAGYYRDGQSPADLAREISEVADRGFRRIKLRVAGATIDDDTARLHAVRAEVGATVELMVDANQGYGSPAEAIRAGRRFEELDIVWLEEPLHAEQRRGAATVANALDMAVAAGENENGRWAFRDMIEQRCADILQPDVTVVGGISEWLRVAALASADGLPIAPHYFPEVHAQLAVAVTGVTAVEYFLPDSDIISFDTFLVEPLDVKEGRARLTDRPGVGLDLRQDAVESHRLM